jgi:RNA polymerase-binding transcription factor DksA
VGQDVQDQKEVAARWQSSGLQDSQQRRDREELDQVDAALHRLDTATYGDCIDCEEPIPLARLLAQPAALRCADCQAALEQKRERASLRGPV